MPQCAIVYTLLQNLLIILPLRGCLERVRELCNPPTRFVTKIPAHVPETYAPLGVVPHLRLARI